MVGDSCGYKQVFNKDIVSRGKCWYETDLLLGVPFILPLYLSQIVVRHLFPLGRPTNENDLHGHFRGNVLDIWWHAARHWAHRTGQLPTWARPNGISLVTWCISVLYANCRGET